MRVAIRLVLRSTGGVISWTSDLFRSPIFTLLKNPARVTSLIRVILKWYRIYFNAQKKTSPIKAAVIETPLDDRIPPDEFSIYPYLFASLYILYVVWHVLDRLSHAQYRRTVAAYDRMIVEAEHFFLHYPTRMRNRSRLKHPLTRFMQTVDGPTNCFPSLHVGLVMLSYQILKDAPATDPLLISTLRKTCIDICRSTMRIKQHSMMDVIGGVALTKRVYDASFNGPFEDLLDAILPELSAREIKPVKKAVKECRDLASLMDLLKVRLTS